MTEQVEYTEEQKAKINELSNEYGAACARLGELSYQIEILSGERSDIIQAIKAINQKAAKVKKGELE